MHFTSHDKFKWWKVCFYLFNLQDVQWFLIYFQFKMDWYHPSSFIIHQIQGHPKYFLIRDSDRNIDQGFQNKEIFGLYFNFISFLEEMMANAIFCSSLFMLAIFNLSNFVILANGSIDLARFGYVMVYKIH